MRVKLVGGLGDVMFQLHTQQIKEIEHKDVRFHIFSDNPETRKLLPKSKVMVDSHREAEFHECALWHKPELRLCYGPLKFNLSDKENRIKKSLKNFIGIAPASAVKIKDIPVSIVNVLRECIPNGVQFGQNYITMNGQEHKEIIYPPFTSVIDKLSPGGVYEVLKSAKGLVTCHTATNIMGWFLKIPMLLCLDRSHYQKEIMPIIKKDPEHYGLAQKHTKILFFDTPVNQVKPIVKSWLSALLTN